MFFSFHATLSKIHFWISTKKKIPSKQTKNSAVVHEFSQSWKPLIKMQKLKKLLKYYLMSGRIKGKYLLTWYYFNFMIHLIFGIYSTSFLNAEHDSTFTNIICALHLFERQPPWKFLQLNLLCSPRSSNSLC